MIAHETEWQPIMWAHCSGRTVGQLQLAKRAHDAGTAVLNCMECSCVPTAVSTVQGVCCGAAYVVSAAGLRTCEL